MHEILPAPHVLDVIVATDGDKVTVELDVRNNASVHVGDQYTARWDDGAVTIMRVSSFKSADDYSNTIARRTEAMREGVAGIPRDLIARKAYQVKLAVMRVDGELLPGGRRVVGTIRLPDVMVPVQRITGDLVEQFSTDPNGNVVLGNLRTGSRTLKRIARIKQNFSGERMIVVGMPGKGKSQLIRSLMSQAMAEDDTGEDIDEENYR